MTGQHSGRFAIVPAQAVEDRRIGNAAFRVLACLGTYADKAGWCWPSAKTIGARLDLSRTTVIEHIKALAKLGYLEVHQNQRQDGGAAPNAYRLLFDRALFEVQDRLEMDAEEGVPPVGSPDTPLSDQPTPPVGSGPTPPVGSRPSTPYKNDPIERPNRTNISSPDSDVGCVETFDRFFSTYPTRRPHSNPQKPARQKFEAAVKDGVDHEEIIRGAKNYARCVAAEGTDPKYVPQAVTWLNQERWPEYQEPPAPAGPAYSGAAI